METLKLRVRCSFVSNAPIIDFLTTETTIRELYDVLASLAEQQADEIKVLYGYPPKIMTGSGSMKLKQLGIKNGEVVFIEKKNVGDPSYIRPDMDSSIGCDSSSCPFKPPVEEANKNQHDSVIPSGGPVSSKENIKSYPVPKVSASGASSLVADTSEESCPGSPKKKKTIISEIGIMFAEGTGAGVMEKREVPSDNSCLFASIDYVLNGSINTERVVALRMLISRLVLEGEKYDIDEVMLGKTRQEYSEWVKKDTSWGGEIELAILSQYYCMEIVALNVKDNIPIRYGETKGYCARVFLLYDGLHYDPLHMKHSNIDGYFYTSFPTSCSEVLSLAITVLQDAHKSGSFTDTNKFTIKCGDCGTCLEGEVAAITHAKQTGHSDFQEVRKS